MTISNPAPEEEISRRIDAALQEFVSLGPPCPVELQAAIEYAVLGPGKRIRPRMVLYAALAVGGDWELALPAACAVEMIHAYSLVHDDLPAMDDDDLRRGRPTCHKKFGEANAILTGDALQPLAFSILAEHIRPAEVAARCCWELAQAAGPAALVGGQFDDLAAEDSSKEPLENNAEQALAQLESIHSRKTGAMFRVSVRLGGIVAGARESQLVSLDQYGQAIGLAFQITDDLLDATGNEADLGKRVRKDASSGKMTYPRLLGVSASRDRAATLVEQAELALDHLPGDTRPLRQLAQRLLDRSR